MTPTIAAVYDVARERWRGALSELGLDPDDEGSKFRVPAGFWFKMADATRADLTEATGHNDVPSNFHRDVPVNDAVRAYLKPLVGTLLTLPAIWEGAEVGRTSLQRWMHDHPGILMQTPTKGLYLVGNAVRADELDDIQAGLKRFMGH